MIRVPVVVESASAWEDILAYGADPTGVLDSTTAIQTAIDALPARGGTVFFPAGEYKVTQKIKFIGVNIPSDGASGGVMLRGEGPKNTVIKATSLTTAVFQSKDITQRYFRCAFMDMEIDNTSSGAAGGVGLDFTKISDSIIVNVRINNCETGLYAKDEAFWNDVVHLLVQSCVTGIKLEKGASTPANEWTFHGGKVLSVTTGFKLIGTTNNKLYGTSFENFTTGIDIASGGTDNNVGVQIVGCRLENPPTSGTGILLDSSQTNTLIVGVHFVGLTTKISGTHPSTIMILADGRLKMGLATLTSNSATPSVEKGNTFVTNNSSPTTITNFLSGSTGQELVIIGNDANTTIAHNANIDLAAKANITLAAGEAIHLANQSGTWRQVQSKRELTGTTTFDPADLADGAVATVSVTVTGAAVGNVAAASFSNALPAGFLISAHVTAADTVSVTLMNKSGSNHNAASGTVRVMVWKF